MEKYIEEKLIDFWMSILPELNFEKRELEQHFKKYLDKDIVQAKRSYESHVKEPLKKRKYRNINISGIDKLLFASFFKRFISLYTDQLSDIIQKTSLIKNKSQFQSRLHVYLYNKLFEQGHLVLINELNYYRQNQLLKGETEEQQFDYFCFEIVTSDDFLFNLEIEYSVFVENLVNIVETTINYIGEIIENTMKHSRDLQKKFGFKINNSLKEIIFMGSDDHNDGKSVCKLVFEDGQLIYKPKSLKLEKNYQELIKIINNKIPDTKLYEMNIFTRDDYGWSEFIQFSQCRQSDEVLRCYKRTGKLLALLHSINGVDFHYENIIFKGEFPVLVDLETLFSAPLKEKLYLSDSAFVRASSILRDSVLSIGLLPTKLKLSENNAVSIGALNSAQKYEVNVPSLDNIGSSKMKIDMRKKKVSTGHESIFQDSSIELDKKILKSLKEGFSECYYWIYNNKELFQNLVVQLFKDSEVRLVIKPTMVYSQLISAANHPDFLTRDIHRKVIFSRVGLLTESESIAKIEIKSLENNDIPYFYCKFTKKHLYSKHNEPIKYSLLYSPKENFLRKMNSINKNDLERQLNFIDSTFFGERVENEITPLINKVEIINDIGSEDYISLANQIGDILKNKAIYGLSKEGEKEIVWLDTNVANMDIEDWTPEVMSFDLYNGLSGLAIFYMNLSIFSFNNENQIIIKTIINMLRRYIKSLSNSNEVVYSGMMTGLSGMFLAIYEFADKYKIKEYEVFVEKEIIKLKNMIQENNPIDFVAGNVGALALMIKIIKKSNNKQLIKKCKNISEEIISNLKENKLSIFHNKNPEETTIYSGFSHGLSGLICYLYEYYKISNEINIYNLFKEFLDYQRNIFWSKDDYDWFISREEQKFSYGWCHGSPGILIEKITLKTLGYHDEFLDQEIESASRNLIESLGTSISMCHGDLGNLLILKQYAVLEKNEEVGLIVRKATNQIYNFIVEQLSNEEMAVFERFKGLMLGLSGVGDFMLKIDSDDARLHLIEYLW